METPPSKAKILSDIRTEWALFEQSLNQLSESQMLISGVTGPWSVKDILAHIIAWEKVLVDRIASITSGGEFRIPRFMNNEDVEKFNHEFFVENRARLLPDVQLEFREQYTSLMTLLEALDEDELFRPVPWDWADESLRLWHIVVANTSDHYQEHRLEIEKYFQQ